MSQEAALTLLRKFFQEGIDMSSAEATYWFKDKMQFSGSIRPSSVIDGMGAGKSRLAAGRMYLFGYKPKGSMELPFFDRFPLVLALQREKGGFLGINFHYLHPNDRADYFNGLQMFVDDESFDLNPDATIAITYSKIKRLSSAYKPTIKRYYYSHIVTKAIEIPPIYWKFVLILPVDRFAKIMREEVWKKSRRML